MKRIGPLGTEIMRIARIRVKHWIHAGGYKINQFSPAEITRAAKMLIKEDETITQVAKDNLRRGRLGHGLFS